MVVNISTRNIEKERASTRDEIFTVVMFAFLIAVAGFFVYFAWTLYGDKVSAQSQSEFEYFVTHCKVNDGGSVICTDEG